MVDPALLVANRDWLHPELNLHIEGISELVKLFDENGNKIPELSSLTDKQLTAAIWFDELPRYGNLAIVVPILHPHICDILVNYIGLKKDEFKPNEKEGKEYQIAELVLCEKEPELHKSFSELAKNSLFLIYYLYWGKHPTLVESIQLARYVPTEFGKTEWHHDRDSNMTGVINLEPDLYKGGGTDIRTGIVEYISVPPVPKGHALIFNGNMTLHRGAEVASGERNLLVYWVTCDRRELLK